MTYRFRNLYTVVFCLMLLAGCQNEPSSDSSNKQSTSTGKERMTEQVSKAVDIKISVVEQEIPATQSLKLKVTLVNVSGKRILVNKRLAPGYWKSDSREIIVDIYNHDTDESASKPANLYERDAAVESDFVWLEENDSVENVVDLREWYDFPVTGKFDIQVTYKTDDVDAFNQHKQPEDVLKGQFTSGKLTIEL